MMPNLGISSFLESIRDFHGLFLEKFPGQYFQKKSIVLKETENMRYCMNNLESFGF